MDKPFTIKGAKDLNLIDKPIIIRSVEDLHLMENRNTGDFCVIQSFKGHRFALVYDGKNWTSVVVPVCDLRCPYHTLLDVYTLQELCEHSKDLDLEQHVQETLLFLESKDEICLLYDDYLNKLYMRTLGMNNIFITSDISSTLI